MEHYEVWDEGWLGSVEASDNNFMKFIVRGKRDENGRGKEHRKRLSGLFFIWCDESHYDLPRKVMRQTYEEELAGLNLWLRRTSDAMELTGESLYRIFYRRVKRSLLEKKKKLLQEEQARQRRAKEMQELLASGCGQYL